MAAAPHVLVRCTVRDADGDHRRRVVPLQFPLEEDRPMTLADLARRVKSELENQLRLEDSDPGPADGHQREVELKGLRWGDKPCDSGRELDYYMPTLRPLVLTADATLKRTR